MEFSLYEACSAHRFTPIRRAPKSERFRPAGLAKYLPRFGWQPTVLTVKQPGLRPTWSPVVETCEQDSLQTWKIRFGLNGKRGLHEQLGLPVTKKRDSQLIHTRLLFAMRYLLTFPDSTKGWIPFAMKELERIQQVPGWTPS